MFVRLWTVLLLVVCGLAGQAQEIIRLTGMAISVGPGSLVVHDASGPDRSVSLNAETKVLMMEPGVTSIAQATSGRLEDIAEGDRLIVSARVYQNVFVALRVIALKATTASAEPALPAQSTVAPAESSPYQQNLEQQALQRLGTGATAGTSDSSAAGPAQNASSGNDLESRALQAMQANTARNEAEAQRRREEEQAQEAAALAAAAPPPAPSEYTAASILNGISAVLGQATTAMQQQNEQQQAQLAQQQQQREQMIALRQQQAEAAAARVRQQQQQAAAARQQQQNAAASVTTGNRQIASNAIPPSAPSTGTASPPNCVYVGGSRGCVPMAEWNAEQQAAAAATRNPAVSADGMTVCPLSGHVTKGHYAACDVWQGQDFSCTPGLKVSIYDGFPNAKGCGTLASNAGGETSAGSSGGPGSGDASSSNGGAQAAGNGPGTHTVAPACTAVDGKWVQNTTFKTKQDLWLVSLCSEDVSVNWFLGDWNAEAGALHAYETTSATGQGVYPGKSTRLSVYVCPIAYPVPVKADGSKVDGHNERYSCATGNPPGFMEPARN